MKKNFFKPVLFLALALGAAVAVAGCEKDDEFTPRNILEVNDAYGYTSIRLQDCEYNLDNMPADPLSDEERNSILFMREEEKLARDVYLRLYEKYYLNVFNNISQSEQTHMDVMLMLIEKYGLTDPVGNKGIGVFANPTLQTMYNDLMAQSDVGLVEALTVGALIEEVDIIDLKNALNTFVDNPDIEMVYENLMRASRNHLRAFVRNMENRGIDYVPQLLTQAEFDQIINSGWETGPHGR